MTPPVIARVRRGSFHTKAGILVVAITFAVWVPAIRNDFVDWDDLNMIVHNPRFNPPTWAGTGWYWIHPAWNLYQPLTTTLWAALAWLGWVSVPDQFGGHMNPALFHLASVLLQTGAAFLLFGILDKAVHNKVAATIGALIFALHPVQTEAVAFVGAMNTPLAGLLGLLVIRQHLIVTDASTLTPKRHTAAVTGAVALLLALLAKPSAVVIPAIAMALDMAIHHRRLGTAFRSIIWWVPLVLPCVIYTKLIQHGAEAARFPAWYRPLFASDAIGFYLRKIIWPWPLAVDYGRTPQYVYNAGYVWISFFGIMATLALFILLSRRVPLLIASAVIFVVAGLPNSGLAPFDYQAISTTADRYIYLSMTGVALVVSWLVAKFSRMAVPFAALLIGLIAITEVQISTWNNGETLFRHALAVNPQSWMSETNLAVSISDRSPGEAISLCRRAILLRPDRPSAWNTLGSLLMTKGLPKPAIEAFRRAHELAPENPIFASNYARASLTPRTESADQMPTKPP